LLCRSLPSSRLRHRFLPPDHSARSAGAGAANYGTRTLMAAAARSARLVLLLVATALAG
jgi:hypothetical protein